MNSGQKTAVSLLLTTGLFVAFIFTYYTNLFTKIETQFYEPERIRQERSQLQESSDFCDSYIQNLLETLAENYVKDSSVKSFLSQTPTESEVTARSQRSAELFSKYQGLDGFRLVDKNGRDLHYSSYADDVAKQSGTTRIYKNYPDIQKNPGELPFDVISVPESSEIPSQKVTFNPPEKQINLSLPVFDKYDVFRGTFVFYFRTSDLERELIKANRISVGDTITLFASDDNLTGGFVIGLPKIGSDFFAKPVLESWKSKSSGPDKVIEAENENYWVILSDYSSKYFSVSETYQSDFFDLPTDTRILICVCVFITVFLLLFLLLSLKHDDMVVIRARIKKIQFALISEYLENKQNVDWQQVSRQIEGRKADLFSDVKRSLGRKGKRHAKEVDALLNKSWEEILSAVGSKQNYHATGHNDAATSVEIKKMLEEVLSTTQLQVQNIQTVTQVATPVESVKPAVAKTSQPVPIAKPASVTETLDEVEEIEEIEEIGEIEEAEDLGEVETIEEIVEIEDVEDLGEVEDFDEVESLDEIEKSTEIADAETLDEVEEIEEIEDIAEAEDLSEVETIGEIGEIEEVEEPAEISDAEDSEDEIGLDEFFTSSELEEINREPPASVNNIFEEKLELGVADTVEEEEVDDTEPTFDFDTSTPDFGEEKELEPVEENNMFTMTTFGAASNHVGDLIGVNDSVAEVNH